MSESNGPNGTQGHLGEREAEEKEEEKRGFCYLVGFSPGTGTLHRWQPRLQQYDPDLAEEPVAKLGLVANPEKSEKSQNCPLLTFKMTSVLHF